MNVELKAERSGSADEAPILFRITKTLPFAADGAKLVFQAEVWCPEATLVRNLCALRAFHERRTHGHIGNEVSITFGVDEVAAPLQAHPGRCTLAFVAKSSRRIIVAVQLTSLQAGRSSTDLLDTCVIHFETETNWFEDFLGHLNESSNFRWQGSLRGIELSE